MNIAPDLNTKKQIIENAVEVARSMEIEELKVACIYNLNDLDDLEECIQYYNELLNKKDIYLKVLKIYCRFFYCLL